TAANGAEANAATPNNAVATLSAVASFAAVWRLRCLASARFGSRVVWQSRHLAVAPLCSLRRQSGMGFSCFTCMLADSKRLDLQRTANEIRQAIIEMLVTAGSGHTAGPLDMADVFTVLYFHTLRHDPANPDWEDRDRLVLSN